MFLVYGIPLSCQFYTNQLDLIQIQLLFFVG
jgi:hypothetical protein